MTRRTSFALTAGLRILLLLSVFAQVWIFPSAVERVVAIFLSAFIALNVLAYTPPGVMLGLIAGGLMALIAAISLVLLGTRPPERQYSNP